MRQQLICLRISSKAGVAQPLVMYLKSVADVQISEVTQVLWPDCFPFIEHAEAEPEKMVQLHKTYCSMAYDFNESLRRKGD